MIPHYKNIHNCFKINGFHIERSSLFQLAYSFIKEGKDFEKEIGLFLLDWFDDNDFILTKTSGTTGKPKEIKIFKQAMVNSAIATGDFFNLKPSDKALHCLPSQFIAGKMMLIRAIILGLEIDLVAPTGKFSINNKEYDFAAMVPLQVEHNFENLSHFKKVIIGGTKLSPALVAKLNKIKSTKFYETYGMTETITHIAIRDLKRPNFKLLPGITISQDNRDCLVIDAPRISTEKIITNDIVKIISKKQFKWIGRVDNVINSGGLKLFPEQIEEKLSSKINLPFFISSLPDKSLGNKVVLFIEGKAKDFESNSLFETMDKYEKPKEVIFLDKFVYTNTGKINREKSKIIKK